MYQYIVIFTCLLVVVNSRELCPSICFCKKNTINCSYRSLSSLGDIEHSADYLDDLILSHNYLNNLPILNAKFIDASSNSVQVFPKLSGRTHALLLNGNKLRFVSEEECPSTLGYLDLSENPIEKIDINCKGLKVLNISQGNVDILDENFLSKFPSIRALHVDDNPIKKINGDLRSDTLEVLSLKRTRIRFLTRTVFSGLSNLKVLDLSGNKFISILQPITTAEYLVANDCSLQTVDFKDMSHINRIEINNNEVVNLVLPESVVELKARNNRITSIDLKKVRGADLSNNRIKSINLKRMDWLDISGNNIKTLNLASIKTLNASHCQISKIVTQNSRLDFLNLSYNALEDFPHGLSLRVLDASFNRLTSFKSLIEGIERLVLIGNRFVLAEDVVAQGSMSLRDNPWTCDCKMDHLYRRADDVSQLRCSHPQNVTWSEACYKSRIPRWMVDYPYLPFIISSVLLVLALIFFYWLRTKLDPFPDNTSEEQRDETTHSEMQTQVNNQLPSYEEALLMPPIAKKVSVLTQTRSYEVLSRRLSSNSI